VNPSVFSHLSTLARQAHPLGRLCFSLGLFTAVLLLRKDIPILLAALCAGVLLLRWQCATWQPQLRAARLLLWLLVPILLLHLLFTPGELLWPGSGIPFTREGLHEGVWLALRLCALFYAAMLLSRSLTREEWAYYCLRLPVFGPRLLPYVKLSAPMRAMAGRAVAETRSQMRQFAGWRDTPRLLRAFSELTGRVWSGSEVEAKAVWNHWKEEADPRQPQGNILTGLFVALAGLLMPLTVWLG